MHSSSSIVGQSAPDVDRRGVLLCAAGLAAAALLTACDRMTVAAAQSPGTMAAAEARRAAERGSLCSSANASGIGLRGEYFARHVGEGAAILVRTDGVVDFDRSFDWPADRATHRPGAARWTGWVKPPITGRYRFHAELPGSRVTVARQTGGGETPAVELSAGRFYPIVIEAEGLDALSGRFRLEWTVPHGARYLVPRALLFLPSDTAPAAKS